MTFRIEDGVPYVNDRPYRWAKKVICDDTHADEWTLNRRGFHLMFESGATLSVTWGSGTYCINHNAFAGSFCDEAPNAEIAVWDQNDNWFTWPHGDQVKGWCSPEFVNELIELLARAGAKGLTEVHSLNA